MRLRVRYRLRRIRLHARAYRLQEVIGYFGLEEGIRYGERRGWISHVEGKDIYLKDPR